MNFSSSIIKSILESNEFQQSLTNVVEEKLNLLKQDLLNAGFDKDKISEIFEKSPENRNFRKKTETLSEKVLGEEYEKSPKGSSKRFLKPNSSVDNFKKEEIPQKINETVYLVIGYGKSSHALFGPFDGKYKSFKDSYLNPTHWIKPNAKLAFGFGWLITTMYINGEEKESLQQRCEKVENKLKKDNIPYRKIQRNDYEEEIRKNKGLEEDSKKSKIKPEEEKSKIKPEEEKPKIKPEEEKPKEKLLEKEKPKEKTKCKTQGDKKKLVLETEPNKWGNICEKETGYVFVKLPVGKNGKELDIVIGWQHRALLTCKGLDSVYPLTKEMEEECEYRKWNFLSERIINIVKKRNMSLGTKYQEFMNKPPYTEDEEDEGSEDEEDEGSEDEEDEGSDYEEYEGSEDEEDEGSEEEED